ncbi:MAG: hypothetical protein ACK5QH_10395 [Rubrivivax sp.]|jgi:hypothetical protein
MQQPSSERLAIAAHLHVAMRRKLGRVTDTEWLAQNIEYAQAMIVLCEQQPDADLQHWARRLEALWAEARPPRASARNGLAAAVQEAASAASELLQRASGGPAREDSLAQRYVGRLR